LGRLCLAVHGCGVLHQVMTLLTDNTKQSANLDSRFTTLLCSAADRSEPMEMCFSTSFTCLELNGFVVHVNNEWSLSISTSGWSLPWVFLSSASCTVKMVHFCFCQFMRFRRPLPFLPLESCLGVDCSTAIVQILGT
jgi:hypothetical protein